MVLGGVAQAFICAAGSGDEAFLFQRDGADGFDLCVDGGGRVAVGLILRGVGDGLLIVGFGLGELLYKTPAKSQCRLLVSACKQ